MKAFGWRTLVLPPGLTLAQRKQFLGWLAPDVIVMQGARYPLNRPDLYPGVPIVYDMDDADFHLRHLVDPVVCAMPDAACVLDNWRSAPVAFLEASARRQVMADVALQSFTERSSVDRIARQMDAPPR